MNSRGTRANLIATQTGNTNAVRSGVYSPRTLAPRAREVADSLLAAPQAVPLDQIAAEEIGSLVALLEAIDADLAKCGLTTRHGHARSLLEYRVRISGRLERWLREFGATPASRLEWVDSAARSDAMASLVRTELLRGRELRQQATERGDLGLVTGGDRADGS